jgi:phage terminase large subunit-like protein
VFQQVARMLDPRRTKQSKLAKITNNVITFPSTGATITALASDYASAAGANPTITVFDELWAYTSERAQRLWDEMVPVPTREISIS